MAAPGSRGSAASWLTANACHRLFGLRSLWFVSPDAATRQPPLCSALPACAPGALRIVRNRQPHIPTDPGIPSPLSPHTQSRRLLTWSGSLSSRTPPASLQISSFNGRPQPLFSKVGLHPSVGSWAVVWHLFLPLAALGDVSGFGSAGQAVCGFTLYSYLSKSLPWLVPLGWHSQQR